MAGMFWRFVSTRPVEINQMPPLTTPTPRARYVCPVLIYTVRIVSILVLTIRAARMITGM
jgi:hypothetical protein